MTRLKGRIIGYKKEGNELTIKLDKELEIVPLNAEVEIRLKKV